MTSSQSGALRRRVVWTGVALIALIIAADGYEAWKDHQAAMAQSERTLVSLSRALAEQTARMVQEIEVALDDYAEWNASAAGQAATPEIARQRLRSHVARLPFVHSASAFGADGHLQASTQEGAAVDVNLSERDVFTEPRRAAGAALYISTPRLGQRDRYLSFALSRKLSAQDGRFAGIVAVRVAFEYLTRFYATVDLSPEGSIRLLRQDGAVLAHYPSGATSTAIDNSVASAFGTPASAQEFLRRDTGPEGEARLVALHKVEAYPIVIEVAQPLAKILSAWRQQELASAARTLLLAVLTGLSLAALAAIMGRNERAELARQQAEGRLQDAQKAETLGLFAASVAHDFNNVLSAIVGYGELARSSTDESSPARGHLDRLLAAGERARILVRRVLTFDRHRGSSNARLAVAPILTEVLDQLRATLPTSISIRTDDLDAQAEILGDATELHQVAMNLCTNAVQAMRNGGEMQLSLQVVPVDVERAVAIGQLTPGRWLRLSVVDSGCGLKPEQLATIFEPFYTTKQSGQGTGIGLTVVRNIVVNMNGAVEVESRPGQSTRFSVYWPILDSVTLPERFTGSPPHADRGQTILVVDDEAPLVAVGEELLASLGYEPVGFTDPRNALRALRADPQRFDALLTDERMPALRGTELALAVHELRPRLPVILVTAYRGTELDLRAAAAGIVQILDKPLRGSELDAVLRRCFS